MPTKEEEEEERQKEDRKKLETIVNEIAHKVLGSRDARIKESVAKLMDEKFTTITKIIEDLGARIPEKQEEKPGKGGRSDKELPDEVKALVASAQKDAADAKKLAEKHMREAQEERDARSRQEEINELTRMLTGSVKPALLGMVVGNLHASNIVRDKDSKKILWKDEDGELLPLRDGIEKWKKSDAGKDVTPPRDARGSGDRGGSAVQGNSGGMTLDVLGGILSGGSR